MDNSIHSNKLSMLDLGQGSQSFPPHYPGGRVKDKFHKIRYHQSVSCPLRDSVRRCSLTPATPSATQICGLCSHLSPVHLATLCQESP